MFPKYLRCLFNYVPLTFIKIGALHNGLVPWLFNSSSSWKSRHVSFHQAFVLLIISLVFLVVTLSVIM